MFIAVADGTARRLGRMRNMTVKEVRQATVAMVSEIYT